MMEDDDLGPILAAARSSRPVPSADLFARVLQDAHDAQPQQAARPTGRTGAAIAGPARRPSLWAALSDMIGGNGAFAGLGTATIAGLWLGYADPVGLEWLTGTLMPAIAGEVDLLQADDLFSGEG